MKTLTLWQPWAQAVAGGLKRVETRPPWAKRMQRMEGERLAIHAAVASAKPGPEHPIWRHATRAVPPAAGGLLRDELRPLTFGAVVATATIGAVLPTSNVNVTPIVESGTTYRNVPWGPTYLAIDQGEWAWGDYDLGRYAVQLLDVVPLPVPVVARGRQQLWDLVPEAEAAVRAQEDAGRVVG